MHILSQKVAFSADAPTEGALAGYLDALRTNARVTPALLSNPMAATNWRSVAHERLLRMMPDPDRCLQTPSVDALEAALAYLLFDRHSNVLVINGGDGTIHHTLNATVRVTARAAAAHGRPVPLPRFLFVCGGGMNMLARVFESRGHPVRTLRAFLARTRGARLGTLPTRAVPLLAVSAPGEDERLGTIFGSELVFNALTMYERFGQGYRGLARFLWEVAAGYTLRTELWHRYGHLLDAPETPLSLDDAVYPRYTSVVATTVPLQLVKGAVATIRRTATPGRVNAVAVLPIDKGEVIARIPALMVGAAARGLVYANDVREIGVHGAYTLDGERFERPSGAPLFVRGSGHVVDGIWLS